MDPAFGVQLHHPHFLECIGAPESVRLLGRPPTEWVQTMDRQDVMAAALQLQRDAGLMASNLQVLGQYLTDAVDNAAPVPQVHRAATQMAAMGLWRSQIGPCDPGPIPVSCCSDCPGCLVCSTGRSG